MTVFTGHAIRTEHHKDLLRRHPILITQPLWDWDRAAAHLDDADAARAAGVPCPWCRKPGQKVTQVPT